MPNYRITFVNNEIATCVETEQRLFLREKNYYFEQYNNKMVIALVRADNEEQAREIVAKLVKEKLKLKK